MDSKKIKAIHFMTDEKFTDGAVGLFECDRRIDNYYYIISNVVNTLKYVKSSNVKCIDVDQIKGIVDDANIIYLHSLYCIPFNSILSLPLYSKIVWFSWGYDTYTADPIIPIKLYHKLTLRFLTKNSVIERIIGNYFTHLLHFKYRNKYNVLLSRISYYSGVFPYEYELIKKNNNSFKAKPLDFYYGSTKFFIPDVLNTDYNKNKRNIIIGNSAAWTNNHLDALNALKKVPRDYYDKIIVPLSYGGSKEYIETVKCFGINHFPKSFMALDSFMPLEDYLALVSNCKAAIFLLERQQASDNILMQIWYGAKVFLPYKSGMYDYLKSIGLYIYSIEYDLCEVRSELDESCVIHNRKTLVDHYSSRSLIQRISHNTDIILNDLQ